ncbi:unnamed protein product [Orchesella dallaii]|uniref:Uncharacterized protein n=1 Tax=Orchesella dallaii TaxID=48710 RepID=A0ABP1RVS5_9HEXA
MLPRLEVLGSRRNNSVDETHHNRNTIIYYICQRTWVSIENAVSIQKNLKSLINIRNIPAVNFHSLYHYCKGSGPNCPILSRSPFPLRFTFPSILLCSLKPSSKLILKLYISFDAIYFTPTENYFHPIFSKAESENKARKFIKILAPTLADPKITEEAASRKMRDFYNVEPSYVAVAINDDGACSVV